MAMVSPLVYSQRALLALIWLFVRLPLTGSKLGRTTPPVPAQPKRKRSTEPKAFEGLTHKPHCALCERETAHPHAPPPVPPAMAAGFTDHGWSRQDVLMFRVPPWPQPQTV